MKIAIPVAANYVSSTFHKADEIILIETKGKEILSKSTLDVHSFNLLERLDTLIHQKIDIVICNSIDNKSNLELSERGISIMPHISGDVDNVIERYHGNNLYFIH